MTTRADEPTLKLGGIIKTRGLKISALAEQTGIPANTLYRAFSAEGQPLKAGEFLALCRAMQINPQECE